MSLAALAMESVALVTSASALSRFALERSTLSRMLRTRSWFSWPSSRVICSATVFRREIISGPWSDRVWSAERLAGITGTPSGWATRSSSASGDPAVIATFDVPVTPVISTAARLSVRTGVSSATSTRTRTAPDWPWASCMSMTLPTVRPA